MRFGPWNAPGWPVQFASPLGAPFWAVLLGVPVGIIALYFLKLRRRPVQVSSTLLWRRSLEDLHVNSLFQRLRKNLLLFLQLLAVLLAMLALLGPRVKGSAGQGQRFILAIDNSASMSATDVPPTRLERAKAEALKVVDGMESDDLAMVIAFADRARVVASYTGNKGQLRSRIGAIPPTQATTSLRDALVVAAGLANPAKDFNADLPEGVVATSISAPKLMIYTDGGFPDVAGLSLGHLEPDVLVIGPPIPPPPPDAAEGGANAKPKPRPVASDNVAIVALQTSRNDERPDQYQIFGRVHNYRAEEVVTEAKLLRRDPARPDAAATLVDAIALKLPPQADQAFKFDLPDPGAAELEVRIDVKDALALDDHAYTLIGSPRKAQVLVVTPGDRYLADALRTTTAAQAADVVIVSPDEARADAVARELGNGRYDLVIYDRTRPAAPPAANALYFGVLPPGKVYAESKPIEGPIILDWNVAHPLMQYVRDLAQIRILKGIAVEPPPGSTRLIESNLGPIAFVAPREGYSDAVLTFGLVEGTTLNTDWMRYYSFPLFLYNAVRLLGNARESAGEEVHAPGQPVVLRAESVQPTIRVVPPPGGKGPATIKRSSQGTFVYNDADATGLYHSRWGKDGGSAFAVNLFDARESDLAPRGLVPEGVTGAAAEKYKIQLGVTAVTGTRKSAPARKDWWKPLALLALGVVLVEWYIYNRRVYI